MSIFTMYLDTADHAYGFQFLNRINSRKSLIGLILSKRAFHLNLFYLTLTID